MFGFKCGLKLLAFALCAIAVARAEEPREDRIVIAETAETFQVSVPVSRLVMTLPRVKIPERSNTHIRAQWTELGTWIDLHISVTTAAPIESARKAAQDILDSVQITATAEE